MPQQRVDDRFEQRRRIPGNVRGNTSGAHGVHRDFDRVGRVQAAGQFGRVRAQQQLADTVVLEAILPPVVFECAQMMEIDGMGGAVRLGGDKYDPRSLAGPV